MIESSAADDVSVRSDHSIWTGAVATIEPLPKIPETIRVVSCSFGFFSVGPIGGLCVGDNKIVGLEILLGTQHSAS